MAVFPKLGIGTRPRDGHAVASAVLGWSVVWLGKQEVSAPSQRSEWCFMSWVTSLHAVVWVEMAELKFDIGFRLVLLLCCGPDGEGVVLQLGSIHRRVCLLVLR
jgi:hypothetical protein